MSSSVDTEQGQRSTKEGTLEIGRKGENCYKKRKLKIDPEDDSSDDLRKVLSTEQLELMSRLVQFQATFESFCNEHSKTIPLNFPLGKSKQAYDQRKRHLGELINNDHYLLQAFCRGMPGISLIPKEDVIPLLHAGLNPLLMLRWARNYDRRKDAVQILPGQSPYTRTNFRRTGHETTADVMFNFFRKVHDLAMSDAEFALLQAVLVFTVCPGLSKPEEVRKQYNIHLRTLWDCALQKSPKRMWEIQSTLNELRAVAARVTKG